MDLNAVLIDRDIAQRLESVNSLSELVLILNRIEASGSRYPDAELDVA